jgi:proliferating cell nuclear antigen
MSSTEFTRICRELTSLSEIVKIDIDGSVAIFSFSGKSGKGKITLKSNNVEKAEDQIYIQCFERVSSIYGLQYLNSFAKASSLCSSITLHLSSIFPLMIVYSIENMGFLKFYLAPKHDEEIN